MKKSLAHTLTLLAAGIIAASASVQAADERRQSSTAQKDAATDTGKAAQKRPESSGDVPDLKERAAGGDIKPGSKPAKGSAAGETGGPAATKGHTGSTTNSSNSPSR